jgi:NTP pyrophosphatase (non-canonical NTP hydrolase)
LKTEDLAILRSIETLRGIELKIESEFEVRHKRKPELADKIKKSIEEAGEVIHADRVNHGRYKNQHWARDGLIDEIADWTIATFSTAYLLGFSDQEIRDGFDRTINKLNKRWNGISKRNV